ncbi:MAG: homocysteine S-methyltransferase family protein, partial [Pseudomonadota bacterium]
KLGGWAKDGMVNIIGGCCGTTPDHVKALAKMIEGLAPREIAPSKNTMRLAGLEPFELAT